MHKFSAVIVATILGVAFYFTLTFGLEGLRLLASPNYGLEEVWHSQYIFVGGRFLNLTPVGLLKLAAFFGALKIAIAAICALHVVDRLRALAGGQAKIEILEGALILIALLSLCVGGSALWSQNAELIRESVVTLVACGLTAALCIIERRIRRETDEEMPVTTLDDIKTARAFSPFR